MPLDLASLVATPDILDLPEADARLLAAMRYVHVARARDSFNLADLIVRLGRVRAVGPFHVFCDELGRAWPDPVALNCACQPALSHDEALIARLAGHARAGEFEPFDRLLCEMIGPAVRRSLWLATRRLVRQIPSRQPIG